MPGRSKSCYNRPLSLALLAVLTVSSCGDDTATPAPVDEFARLTLSSWAPQQSSWVQSFEWCLDEIERRTDHRVAIDRFWQGSVVPQGLEIEALQNGLVDASTLNPGFVPDSLPYLTVGLLPGLTDSFSAANAAILELGRSSPAVDAEWARWGAMPLCTNGLVSFQLLVNREIDSLDDLAGMQVWASGGQAVVAETLGMVPLLVPVTEIASAVEQGNIDAVVSDYDLFDVFGLERYGGYVVEIDFGAVGQSLGLSRTAWEALPTDIQDIISQVSNDSIAAMASVYEGGVLRSRDALVARGLVIVQAPPDVKEAMEQAVVSAQEQWVTSLEAAGYSDATSVLEEYQRLIRVYETAG